MRATHLRRLHPMAAARTSCESTPQREDNDEDAQDGKGGGADAGISEDQEYDADDEIKPMLPHSVNDFLIYADL